MNVRRPPDHTMGLLEIKDLTIRYHTSDGIVSAVTNLDIGIGEGETLGLVGETGAGKTTTALGIMSLIPDPPGRVESGEILFDGEDLLKKTDAEMQKIRGNEISMIFQDPMTALNPIMTINRQITEVVRLHNDCSRYDAKKRADEILELVGIPSSRGADYPHQFSGGMKQRVVIAMGIACSPKLIIADEPTTALDVTIQAQVLEMMYELKEKLKTSMLLITHDLGVVAEICDHVAIMYAGEIVEKGTLEHIFDNYAHPYTIGLFGSLPSLDKDVKRLSPIAGLMPDPSNLPAGCRFHPRCPHATEKCAADIPVAAEVEPGHMVRCHNPVKRKAWL